MRVARVWSFMVSSARRDQEIEVTSSVSLLMAAVMITSDRSVTDSADNSVHHRVPGCSVRSKVGRPWQVFDSKVPREGPLFEAEKSCVAYLI